MPTPLPSFFAPGASSRLASRAVLLVALYLLGFSAHAQSWQWVSQAAARPSSSGSFTNSTATDAAGNVYVTGYFQQSISLGSISLTSPDHSNMFVAKLNPSGQYQWAIKVAGASPTGLALDAAGNAYLTGTFGGERRTATFGSTTLTNNDPSQYPSPDVFVAKLNGTGQWQWAVKAGGPDADLGVDLALDAAGDVYVTGHFASASATFGNTTLLNSVAQPGPYNYNIFVAKLNASGQWQWASKAGGANTDQASGLAVDGNGGVYIIGTYASNPAVFGTYSLTGSGYSNLFVAKLTAASGTWQWASKSGGTGYGYGVSLAADAAGNVYAAGNFSGTLTFGAATVTTGASLSSFSEVYVAKLNASGQWQWASKAGGTADDMAQSIAVDATGNAFVAGSFHSPTATFGTLTLTNSTPQPASASSTESDLYVAKLSAAGQWLWATNATGTRGEDASDVALDASGNVFISGDFYSSRLTAGSSVLPSNGYGSNILVAKLNAAGAWQWAASNVGSSGYFTNGVARDASGNLYVVGNFSGTVSFGATTLVSNGADDFFVGKLDATGQWQWAAQGGGEDGEYSSALTLDAAGNVYVSGSFSSLSAQFGSFSLTNNDNTRGSYATDDVFVGKLNASGQWQWVSKGGGTDTDYSNHVVVDAAGRVYVCGSSNSSSLAFGSTTLSNNTSSYNAFVARLDGSTGAWQWATQVGGASRDEATSMALDAAGNLYLTGSFSGAGVAFGSTTLTSSGEGDIFLAQLSPAGQWQWALRAGGRHDDFGGRMAFDAAGNLYLAGSFHGPTATFGTISLASTSTDSSDVFVARVPSGVASWQWAVKAGGAGDDYGYALATDGAGGVYVGGTFFGPTASFGSTSLANSYVNPLDDPSSDLFVAKLAAANGQWLGAVKAGSTGYDGAFGLVTDPAGGVYVAGYVGTGATFGSIPTTSSLDYDNGFVAKLGGFVTAAQPRSSADGQITAYPNPFADQLTLRIDAPVAAATLTLRDALGRTVRQQRVSVPASREVSVPVAALPAGLYFLSIDAASYHGVVPVTRH
ncbi:SBBP repeat-containing protein [Hymenobacter sp. 15J16-1T3B]|uniref:SBBP repeat-containing protein n=1 Tax=Hymenobacter sp. 15J16-1T3B TaxID=2886941 RepID=UPI001D118487|nr:SBBP repeat-containing protein [Hymenobacter sp. 15J16-1T3B]MCC3155729.1 SBBP repeat-containing protein [Hymenobacter sp. 15J16-1T3B]